MNEALQKRLEQIDGLRASLLTIEEELETLLGFNQVRIVEQKIERKKLDIPNKNLYKFTHRKTRIAAGQPVGPEPKVKHQCCGSKQNRHLKSCKNATKPVENLGQVNEVAVPIDRQEYEDLRAAMHDGGFASGRYALSNKLRPTEVNAAVRSANYEEYLNGREEPVTDMIDHG